MHGVEIDVVAVFDVSSQYLATMISEGHKNVKWIHVFSTGINSQSSKTLLEHPAPITRGKGAFADSLAEFIMFGILYIEKRYSEYLKVNKEHKWLVGKDRIFVGMMRDKTLGIVGYGDIAIECARMAKHGFKTRIFALKRDPSSVTEEGKELADEIVGLDGLDRLLAESDYVLNVLPLTAETENLFGAKEFAKMKKDSIYANIGRGGT